MPQLPLTKFDDFLVISDFLLSQPLFPSLGHPLVLQQIAQKMAILI